MDMFKVISAFTFGLVMLGIIGAMDFNDEITIQKDKCEFYQGGQWIENHTDNKFYCKWK